MKVGDYVVIRRKKWISREGKRGFDFEEFGMELDRGLVVAVHACGFVGPNTVYGCTLLSSNHDGSRKTYDLEYPLYAQVLHEN